MKEILLRVQKIKNDDGTSLEIPFSVPENFQEWLNEGHTEEGLQSAIISEYKRQVGNILRSWAKDVEAGVVPDGIPDDVKEELSSVKLTATRKSSGRRPAKAVSLSDLLSEEEMDKVKSLTKSQTLEILAQSSVYKMADYIKSI